MNISEYVKAFGETELTPYNMRIADQLVFSALSYTDFTMVSDGFQSKMKLSDAINQLFAFSLFLPEDEQKFLLSLRESRRFSDLYIMGYRHDYAGLDNPMQFSSLTIQISESLFFISYSGTDGTVVGWKEDFQFSYLLQTPAQEKALSYLNEAAEHLNGHFIIGGHSKGGHLSVYAALHAERQVRERINQVYNNDGPGFNKQVSITSKESYQETVDKLSCIVPQDSVIGQLLETFPKSCYRVVHSNSDKFLWEHDIFTWQIDESGSLQWEPALNKKTHAAMKILNSLIQNIPLDICEQLTNFIFNEMDKQDIKLVDALNNFVLTSLPIEYLKYAKKSE